MALAAERPGAREVKIRLPKVMRRRAKRRHRDPFSKFIYSPVPAAEQKNCVVRYNSPPHLLRATIRRRARGEQGLSFRPARTSHQGIAMSSHVYPGIASPPFPYGLRRALVATALAVAIGVAYAQNPPNPPASLSSPSSTTTNSKFGAKVTELQTIELQQGTGAEAVSGKAVIVHYTGWLYDPAAADGHGAKFDSSLDRKVPFGFFLGSGKVIKGWDEGIVGMKVGGKRTLVIPPHKAYGERGAGGVIPPNATLLFDVELIEVKG